MHGKFPCYITIIPSKHIQVCDSYTALLLVLSHTFGIQCNGPSVICPDCILLDAPWPHPNTVSAQAVNRSGVITVSWTAPVVPTGELPITGYSIRYHTRGSGVSGYQYMNATQSPAEVTGLLPGTEYQVYVASVSAIGTGLYCCMGTPSYVTTYNGKLDVLCCMMCLYW